MSELYRCEVCEEHATKTLYDIDHRICGIYCDRCYRNILKTLTSGSHTAMQSVENIERGEK